MEYQTDSSDRKICLSCARMRMAQMKEPSAFPLYQYIHARCEDCAFVNEDVRARVYARAAAVVRADRLIRDAEAYADMPSVGAPIEMPELKGLRVPMPEGEK